MSQQGEYGASGGCAQPCMRCCLPCSTVPGIEVRLLFLTWCCKTSTLGKSCMNQCTLGTLMKLCYQSCQTYFMSKKYTLYQNSLHLHWNTLRKYESKQIKHWLWSCASISIPANPSLWSDTRAFQKVNGKWDLKLSLFWYKKFKSMNFFFPQYTSSINF